MTMIFCRGCGKQIHNSAPYCPHCGAPQAGSSTPSKLGWMSIVAIILGGLAFLGSFNFTSGDKEELLGFALFGAISILLAGINLHQKQPGRNLSIIAIVLATLGLLICLGNLH